MKNYRLLTVLINGKCDVIEFKANTMATALIITSRLRELKGFISYTLIEER